MSQKKVAGVLGVPEGTIARWDAEAKKDASILRAKDTSNLQKVGRAYLGAGRGICQGDFRPATETDGVALGER